MRFDAHPYGGVASFYDELAGFYSRGRIERSKHHFIGSLRPGERVLFVGVGRGSEAIEAAAAGVHVSAIDLSPSMIRRFRQGLAARDLEAETMEGDVAGHRPAERFDAIVAHYFLNLYRLDAVDEMLRMLRGQLRPGGRMLIADFAPPEGGALSRWLTAAYYRPVNVIAWALGYCALHPIPDYAQLLPRAGLSIEAIERFPVFGFRDPAYLSILARRLD